MTLNQQSLLPQLQYKLHPKIQNLVVLAERTSQRVSKAGSSLSLLDEEQRRIEHVSNVFVQVKLIQSVVSRLSSSSSNMDDNALISNAKQISSISQEALNVYEIRYGLSAEKELKELRDKALHLLFSQLDSAFKADMNTEILNQISVVLSSITLIGCAEDGIVYYSTLLRSHFINSVKQKTKYLQNVQLPFSGQVSILFDCATELLHWNSTELSEEHYQVIFDQLIQETSVKCGSIVSAFCENVLSNQNLKELPLIDLALTEAVSMVRQITAFKRHFGLMKCYDSAFHESMTNSLSISVQNLLELYAERENLYQIEAISVVLSGKANELDLAEDCIFIGKKCIRRALATLESSTIQRIISGFYEEYSRKVIAALKKSSDFPKHCNALSLAIGCLDSVVSMIERELTLLDDGEIWSFSSTGSHSMKIFSVISDLRRLSDSLENELRSKLYEFLRSRKALTGLYSKIVKIVNNNDYLNDDIWTEFEKIVAALENSFIEDNIRRIWILLAKLTSEQMSKMAQNVKEVPSVQILEELSAVFTRKFSFVTETDCKSFLILAES